MSSSTNNHPSDNSNSNGGGGSNNSNNNNNNPYRRSKSDPQDDSSNATGSTTGTGTDATAAVSTSLLLPSSMTSSGTNDDHLPRMPQGNTDGPYSFNIEDMSLIALLSRVNSLSSLQPQPPSLSSSSFPPQLLPPPLFSTLLDEADPSRRTSQLPSYRNHGEESPNDESSSSLSTSMRTSSSTATSSIPSESLPQSPPTATMSPQEHQLTLLRSILDMATMIGSGTTTEVSPRRTRVHNHNDYDVRSSSSDSGNSHGKQHRRRNSFPPRQ
jgi:hypothetical protein